MTNLTSITVSIICILSHFLLCHTTQSSANIHVFRAQKGKGCAQGHTALGPSSIQTLITKLPAQIPKTGYEHFSRIGTVYRLSLYHRHTTEAYLGEALTLWASATNYSQGNVKRRNRFIRSSGMDTCKYMKCL